MSAKAAIAIGLGVVVGGYVGASSVALLGPIGLLLSITLGGVIGALSGLAAAEVKS